jgi:sarcosine oxidase
VTLVDRADPGHPGAESGGESRLIRFSHGPDTHYTRSAWRSLALWTELEEELGVELVVRCGVAWFARRDDGWEAEAEGVMRAEGIPVERLAPGDGVALYPSLRTDDLAFVLLEPAAGVLRAAAATRALAERACRRGVRLVRGDARPGARERRAGAAGHGGASGRGAAAVLIDGEPLEADVVVWACGAWLAPLFPEAVELSVTRQDVVFFEAPGDWDAGRVPAYADYDGAAYGLGPLDGHGMKVAMDFDGPPVDPDRRPETAAAESERAAREYLDLRFPGLSGARVERAKVCHYSATGDMSFLAGPHPELEGVWIVGGGSGHGFKHGPAVAEHVAGAIAGRVEPEPRYAVGPRAGGRSLRTAGWSGGDA